MFTPDMLNLWGNTVGHIGNWAFLALAVGVVVFMAIAYGFRLAFVNDSNAYGDLNLFSRLMGDTLARLILASGKIPLAVSVSSGLLVSAGFVFNEVFVYWFPNFAFAYLLLGLVAIVNLSGQKAVAVGQIFAVAIVLIGMLTLLGRSFWVAGTVDPHETVSMPAYFFTGMVVLMGFDIALYGQFKNKKDKTRPWPAIFGAIIVGGILLALWGWVAQGTVSSSKLADSTISHMIIARTIWGQPGRYIMGCIVIASVFAAVNGLMYCASHVLSRVTKPAVSKNINIIANHHLVQSRDPSAKPMVMLLCIFTFFAMVGGLAGESILETVIQAGVILWLIHYGTVNFCVWWQSHLAKTSQGDHLKPYGLIPWVAILGSIAAIAGVIALAPALETIVYVLALILLVLAGMLLFLGMVRKFYFQRGG